MATRGSDGLIFTDRSGSYRVRTPCGVSGNPTGAGDAAAAGIALALSRGSDILTAICDGVALGTSAVAMPVAGLVDLELFHQVRAQVTAERMEGTS